MEECDRLYYLLRGCHIARNRHLWLSTLVFLNRSVISIAIYLQENLQAPPPRLPLDSLNLDIIDATIKQISAIVNQSIDRIITARRVCIARTMPWQDVCPSVRPFVRPSVTRRYCF